MKTTLRRKSNARFPATRLALFMLLAGLCEPVFQHTALAQPPTPVIYAGDTELGPFGIGGCAMRSNNLPSWIPQMAKIGIHILRTPGGTGFKKSEPGSFAKLDEGLAYLATEHFASGGTFFCSHKEFDGLPTADLPLWAAHVTELVGHARGKIKFWELWNEPPNGTGKTQTADDYAKYAVATYDAAKKGNPDCMIGLAAKSAHVNYLDQAIRAGAKGHFDYITLHPYETLGAATSTPGAEAIYMQIVPNVRKMLAALDPSKVNAPVLFTELGCNAGKKGPEQQAYSLIKAYTMGIAQGVACIQWFEGMDGDSGPMGIIAANGTPRPSYVAMGKLIEHLGQHPAYLGWVLINDKDYGFVFQGAKGTVMVTWAPVGGSDNLKFSQPAQIINLLTGNATQARDYALTESPIMIVGVPADLLSQAKENKTKPFPWGGDYTNAKSVSVTMGEKNVEKGLHTKSAASVAADVIAYGGNARSGTIPGGNIFIIDPNFLSYTPTPVEISAVVRRGQNNAPCNLKIKYESPNAKDGYKDGPAYDVPDQQGWSTIKWRLDDAQFVGMYGYSFSFNQGPYYIQSVTVTKLAK